MGDPRLVYLLKPPDPRTGELPGQMYIDSIGAEGNQQSLRTVRKVEGNMRKILKNFDASIGFYPEQIKNSTDSTFTRIHVRPVVSKVKPVDGQDVLLAPSTDEKISRLSTALKSRVLDDGLSQVEGCGAASLNRIIKGLIRANSFIEKESKEQNMERVYLWQKMERVYLWAVPGEVQRESDSEKPSVPMHFDVIKGPALK
eukprot:Skav214743  [mRNA]  locus=scaffold983:75259:75858:- [translate_table: standard]